jgi:hypothetical protein
MNHELEGISDLRFEISEERKRTGTRKKRNGS